MDFFKQIRKHSDEEIGRLFRALVADIDGSESPELPATLDMIKEMIQDQNERFVKNQSEKGNKGGAPKGNENAQKQPKQPSVPVPVPDTKIKNTPPNPPKGGKGELFLLVDKLVESEKVSQAVKGWIDMRFRKPKERWPTKRAVELAINKVGGLGYDENRAADCFNESTINGWSGIFPLRGG